ncbi:unnamed protein product [Pleuronectes platessa]|uniref:Uncharacterized protein n=1 Tax=Pleuronectes platessa TaxID=8262 RepID=A0A9N7TV71_PLEPL|nr:unnamed protein product [Pleuronectes platessa]
MHTCWEERKFQREQVGVAIAIYQDDFDLPHASVTTAQIYWMDQVGLQCMHEPRCNNSPTLNEAEMERRRPLSLFPLRANNGRGKGDREMALAQKQCRARTEGKAQVGVCSG